MSITDHNPKVSMIIPVYNVEQYLMRCMKTVIHQTYTNLEIIMVDDGSTDHSGDICDELAAQDPRVRVIHRKNGGQPEARNTGLRLPPDGALLMFIDSDDWLDLDTVETCVKLFQKYPETQCVLFPYIREFGDRQGAIDFFGPTLRVFDQEAVRTKIFRRLIGPYGAEKRHPDSMSDLNAMWGKMFDTRLLKGHFFVDVKEIGSAEDGLFNLCIFRNIRQAVYTPSIHYHYNKENSTSVVHTYNKNLFQTRLNYYQRVEKILKGMSEDDTYRIALNNRKVFETLLLNINVTNSSLDLQEKVRLIRELLAKQELKNWFKSFTYDDVGLIWRVYYKLCQHEMARSVLLLTTLANSLKKYLR